MNDWDPAAFENALIDDMRAHDGKVTTGPLRGHPLLIMTSQGAKTGQPHPAILTYHRDGGDYVVAGTAGGSPTTPAWVHNVRENPEVTVEVDNRPFEATATEVGGAERDELWHEHVAQLPHFGDYPKKTDRVFPIVRLTPKAG
jgi:deazaflavin-dependent oxidoreductase (nitroreductase family)